MFDFVFLAPGLLLAAFFGSLIQRIAGMGFGIAVSGFALATYDPFTAVYVSAIVGMGVTLVTLIQLRGHVVWSATLPLLPPLMIFMLLGFWLAHMYGQIPLVRSAFQAFGLFLIILALATLLRGNRPGHSPLMARPWIGGSFSGLMSGTVGMPGPTIAPYFYDRGIVGTAFVASICPMFFITSSSRVVLGAGVNFQSQDLQIALAGAGLAVLAVFVGGWISHLFSARMQRGMIIGLALIAAGRLAHALLSNT